MLNTCFMIHLVVEWMKKQLKKLFSYLFSKKSSNYIQAIIDAANNKGYVESYSNKADSLHLSIKRLYEEDIQSGFIAIMKKLASRFRKNKVRLAVDFQEHGFYGETNNFYIIGTSYEGKPYPKAFRFITVSILTGNKDERIPLYALPWHIGQDIVESVNVLVKVIRPWLGKIEVIQFDRGFYQKMLIKYLEENKIPYLIHIKKNGRYLKELIKNTGEFYKCKYKLKVNMNKSCFITATNLYVCKSIEKKDWLFVSSLDFRDKYGVRNMYRNRWQIETNYAVHNSVRIMSRSTNYIVRYFYYIVDILLQVLWRLCSCKIPFRTFMFSMVIGVDNMLMRKPCLRFT